MKLVRNLIIGAVVVGVLFYVLVFVTAWAQTIETGKRGITYEKI